MFAGEVMGVLAVFSRAQIQESEFGWLRIFADHAAVAIANARAFDEITELSKRFEMERDYLREEVKEALAFGEIVGQSTALRGVLEQLEMVGPTEVTVLILGESGTGKELVASRLEVMRWCASIAVRFQRSCLKASSVGTRGELSPERFAIGDVSSWPMAAACFSTK